MTALLALLTPEVLSILIPALLTGIGALWRLFAKDKADSQQKLFALAVEVAYNCVNDVAKRTENKIDDKVALGLKYLNDFYNAHGQQPTEVDVEKAKILFQAMNGAGK